MYVSPQRKRMGGAGGAKTGEEPASDVKPARHFVTASTLPP